MFLASFSASRYFLLSSCILHMPLRCCFGSGVSDLGVTMFLVHGGRVIACLIYPLNANYHYKRPSGNAVRHSESVWILRPRNLRDGGTFSRKRALNRTSQKADVSIWHKSGRFARNRLKSRFFANYQNEPPLGLSLILSFGLLFLTLCRFISLPIDTFSITLSFFGPLSSDTFGRLNFYHYWC